MLHSRVQTKNGAKSFVIQSPHWLTQAEKKNQHTDKERAGERDIAIAAELLGGIYSYEALFAPLLRSFMFPNRIRLRANLTQIAVVVLMYLKVTHRRSYPLFSDLRYHIVCSAIAVSFEELNLQKFTTFMILTYAFLVIYAHLCINILRFRFSSLKILCSKNIFFNNILCEEWIMPLQLLTWIIHEYNHGAI